MRFLRLAALLAAGAVAGSVVTPVAQAQPGCADLGGAVDPQGICRMHTANASYTVDMSFPNDYPDQAPLIGFLTQTRDGFVNVAQDPDAHNLPYELDAEGAGYQSGLSTAGTRSVVFTVWQNVGGAHPQTFYQAFNWNVATGAPITFDTLFKPGTKPLDVIYPEVNHNLQTEQGVTDHISQSEGLDESNYQNFAITDDSVIFFFSQGEVFAEAAGPVEARVARSDLAPMLAI
jgi:hypothetical protein